MTLRKRKLTIVIAVAAIIILANVWGIAALLDRAGVIRVADHIRREYLTGTAIAVIVVLLFLLKEPICMAAGWIKRCRVCQRLLMGSPRYCAKCGSRM